MGGLGICQLLARIQDLIGLHIKNKIKIIVLNEYRRDMTQNKRANVNERGKAI